MVDRRTRSRSSIYPIRCAESVKSGCNDTLRRHVGRLAQLILASVLVMVMLGCENLLGEDGDEEEDGDRSPLSVSIGAPSYDDTQRTLTFNGVSVENIGSEAIFDLYLWLFISQDDEVGNDDDVFISVFELLGGGLFAGESLFVRSIDTRSYVSPDIGGTFRIAVVATQVADPSTFSGTVHPSAISTEIFSPTRTALAVRILLNSDGISSRRASAADMVLNNNYLYVATNDGSAGNVYSVNVGNPASPTAGLPATSTNPRPSEIAVSGTSLYVGGSSDFASSNDLLVYDITNPASPSSPNAVALTNGSDSDERLFDVVVNPARNRLYTLTSTGLAGYDTSTDLSSKLFFEESIDTDSSTSALFSADHVFAFSDGFGGLDSYTAVFVNDDMIDTGIGGDVTQRTNTAFDSVASDISGTTVALVDDSTIPDSIQLVDVGTPNTPNAFAGWDLESNVVAHDVAIDGNFVYVAHNTGVAVYDITVTNDVRLVSSFSLLGTPGVPARSIYLDANTAYVIHSVDLSGIENDATFFIALDRAFYESDGTASMHSQAVGTTPAMMSLQEELSRFFAPVTAPSESGDQMWRRLR